MLRADRVSDDDQPARADLLQGQVEPEPPSRRILLVRHGHYERVDQLGDHVWGLSPLGRRQAARTGRRLVRLLSAHAGKLEGIYSSPWPRSLQTAEIAAHELGIDRIRVKDYLHESVALVPFAADGISSAHPLLPVTPPDERAEVAAQVRRVLARFFRPTHESSSLLIFTHGNLIRYLVAETLGLPYETWMRISICHASISEIRIYPGNMPALMSFNETGHLPPDMISA